MKTKKPRSKVSKQTPPGYLCFSLDPNGPTRQRASYSNERREEVNDIRKSGACLRCQLLKKPCSRGDPCDRCIKAAAKNSSSRCLSWMDCIRPSLQKLSIYGTDISSLNDLALGGVPVLQYFADEDVQLKFDIPFQWNIDELSTFLAGWLLADPESSTAASMVGIMSSASLYSTLSAIIGSELAQIFKILIYTTSLLYNAGGDHLGGQFESHDVKVIRYCGGRILQFLESQLRPSQLAKLTRHKLYAAFLLLLGTAIASNYFEEVLGLDFSQPSTEQEHEFSSKSVGAELVKLLSHYIVYIGQQTGLIHSSIYNMTSRGLLLFETKKPRFTWESTGHSRSRLCCNTGSENGGPRISTETWDQSVELPSIPVALDSAADVNLVTPSLRLAMEDVCFDSGQPQSSHPEYLGHHDPAETRDSDIIARELDISSLDAIAIRLLENMDIDMLDDQDLLEPKYSEDGSRKDSLGYDLVLDESILQPWDDDKVESDLPTADIGSTIFEADPDQSWPCFNRIPTPDPTEMDEIFETVSWDTMVQGTHPSFSCGILPSCTSSPSGDGSPSESPRLAAHLVVFDACVSGLQSRDSNNPGLNLGKSSLPPFADNSRTDFLDFIDNERDRRWPYFNPLSSPRNRDVASQLRKDRHPSSPTLDRRSTNVCWACSIVNDSCEPGQAEKVCQRCSVRSVKKQAIGRLVSDGLQIEQLFDLLRHQLDNVQTTFNLGLLERIHRMQREEAPFSFDQLLDKIREQLEGEVPQSFEERLDQLRQNFLESASEKRLLL